MGVKATHSKTVKRKDGGAKYRVESGRKTEFYRDESGKLMRKETRYRRIVRKDGGGR